MKLILRDKGETFAVLEVPDNSVKHQVIKYGHPCLDCAKIHVAKFKYAGIHDDGMIYELQGIHQ